MIEGSSDKNSSGRPGWGTWMYSKRESAWYVLMFIIPYLSFRILVATTEAISDLESTGQFSYPEGYIPVAGATLFFCGLIPFLLKDSDADFRFGAILLTSVVPGLLVAWTWVSMVRFVDVEQAYRTSDPVGHYFVSRRVYDLYKQRYLSASSHKAIAQSRSGAWAWEADQPTAIKAAEHALIRCMDKNRDNESEHPCDITLVDDLWFKPPLGYEQ